ALEGNDRLRITVPSGYNLASPADSVFRVITPGLREVSWNLQAPDSPPLSLQSFIIEVVESSRNARDENTNQLPPLTPNPPRVSFTVQTRGIGLEVIELTDRKPTNVRRGATNLAVFGLQLENQGDTEILIDAISMIVREGTTPIAPNSIFSRIAVVDYFNAATIFLNLSPPPATNPLVLTFQPAISILANQSVSIEFQVDVLAQSTAGTFELRIDSPQSDIEARDVGSNRLVEIIDTNGQPISAALTPGPSNLFDESLEATFHNYPNPFGNNASSTTQIVYQLEQDSDVNIRIYTLLGELVWSRSFSATNPEGIANGRFKEITWDGTNDQGQKILNGVYVAVLTTNHGKATTKIAVAK
ncbi:MAG TPA: T9SS type A sorting domain-containing protein, partial [bacterium]